MWSLACRVPGERSVVTGLPCARGGEWGQTQRDRMKYHRLIDWFHIVTLDTPKHYICLRGSVIFSAFKFKMKAQKVQSKS